MSNFFTITAVDQNYLIKIVALSHGKAKVISRRNLFIGLAFKPEIRIRNKFSSRFEFYNKYVDEKTTIQLNMSKRNY